MSVLITGLFLRGPYKRVEDLTVKPDGLKVQVKKGLITANQALMRLTWLDGPINPLRSKTARWLLKRAKEEKAW